ncbi:MAG: T9SS type A sorting domain-containing protein, partial [candidate division WOR-3 bacterium]
SGVVSSQYPVASMKIYDITGRVVKSFDLESCILNHESRITWFGDDDTGRKLPAGIYFIEFRENEYKEIQKVILIK